VPRPRHHSSNAPSRVAAVQRATVTSTLVAVLPALLDAVDLCQAHWRAAAKRSELETALDDHLDQTARGQLVPPGTLRALQGEITRQRLTQPGYPTGATGYAAPVTRSQCGLLPTGSHGGWKRNSPRRPTAGR
jgi:hypothetical protein